MIAASEETVEILQKAMDRAYEFFRDRDFVNAQCLYEQVLKINPQHTEAIHMLGLSEYEMGHKERSLNLLVDAEKKGCCSWQFYNSLGTVKSFFNQSKEAVKHFQESITINPLASAVYVNLGIEYSKQHKFKKAEQSFLKAITIDPGNPYIWFNIGNIYSQQLKTDKAIKSFRKSIEINNNFLPARWNLSHQLLMTGQFAEGWKEYECRWQLFEPYAHVRRKFSKCKLWTGQTIEGKSIALYSEQGTGDAIQFIRYARILKEMGAAHVALEWPVGQTRGDVSKVLSTVEGVDQIIHGPNQDIDYHQSLLSLPLITGFNMYWDKPYIKIEATKKRSKKIKVGIAWKGNPMHFNDQNRSCPVESFSEISHMPKIELHNLHREKCKTNFVLHHSKIEDFQDTAKVISNMDCILTVDTAIAHLSAAMGKPTFILIPYIPDWRWMLHKTTSPWYGTVRLLRQTKVGHWEQPLQQAQALLAEFS